MSATKAQINWTAVSHGATNITRVTNAMFGQGGNLIKFKGDTDLYPSVIANVDNEPHASVTTADVGTMMGINPGTTATLNATLNDAKAQTGGAVVFALANAVFENADTTAQHAQFASVTGTWQAFASDGLTNPLSFTRT
jgi:hypothetical protein